tara:strand:+ start:153 stop:1058 length:906 start_codon:yes stop_codon:yes gene_type:complete
MKGGKHMRKKGKTKRRMNIASVAKSATPVITLLGHKYDKATLPSYTKIKDGAVFSVPREDFHKFKLLKRNRNTSQAQVNKLIVKLQEPKGQLVPIIINEKWEVINGQHRLQAAEEGNIDHIIVMMSFGATIEDVIIMNTTEKKWNFWDYLKCHSEPSAPSSEEYQKIKTFLKDYTISPKAALWLLSGNNHDYGTEDFEAGIFEVKHLEEAQKQGDYLRKVKGYNTVNVSVLKFCWSFVKIQKTKDKDGNKMSMPTLMRNLKKYGGKFFNTGGNQEYYLDEMKECYNSRLPKSKKISLRVSL